MTATYQVGCCSQDIAEIDIVDGHIAAIRPPNGEDLYKVAPPNRLEGLTAEQMKLEYQARDKMHSLVMQRTSDSHVSEVVWPDHSSWVLRCLDCGNQFEVAESAKPKLARVLGASDWSKVGGVVPLGVLNRS